MTEQQIKIRRNGCWSEMNYRAEINGLRAFAVIPVLLFHAEITKGGFLGVDIFFVISGYLISAILIESLQTNKFSFQHFYERRARRILPALLFITAATIPFAIYFLAPTQLQAYGRSLISIPFFTSNFLFFREADYFADSFKFIPLLHTWSVAVEEQFYLLFPAFLFLVWAWQRKFILASLVVLIIASLGYAEAIGTNYATENFYLLPSRIWELMFGAVLTVLEMKYSRRSTKFLNMTMVLTGLLVLLACFMLFDDSFIHPGFVTLIPVLATCAIIWFSGGQDLGTKFLTSRLMVSIGLISYSIYLWHMPILTFSRFANIGELSQTVKIVFIPVTLFLSYFSYIFIEKPFRKSAIVQRKTLFIYIFSLSAIIVIFGVLFANNLLLVKNNLPDSIYSTMVRVTRAYSPCYYKNTLDTNEWYCKLGNSAKLEINFAVTGDSLALDLSEPLRLAAKEVNSRGVLSFIPGCLPFRHDDLGMKEDVECVQLNDRMFDFVKDNKIKNIIMAANWYDYLAKFDAEKKKIFAADLEKSIDAYNEIGATVYIMLQAPKQKLYPIEIYKTLQQQSADTRQDSLSSYSVTKAEQDQEQKLILNVCAQIHNRKFVILDYHDQFCDDYVCPVGTLNTAYYFDLQHLSRAGAMQYVKPFTALLTRFNHEK